ncbi:hypothetical protein [Streptomyces sp. ZSW22]|uniref:hypothetical protein n=1 Tax=Streptomyces sp. ZSW22 TaxID=3055050 RepID=UPI0025AF53A6|nr:hypothetical protein [Streptomyces sp. ZSW22]MDN3244096.1 hypothetical protein [Streptomyces sp. ZSW22]
MSISPLAMAAKKVIDAAFVNGPAYDLASVAAFALESACLLQDPETAAAREQAAETARAAVAVAESSVALLKREHAENARLRERIAELETGAKATADGYPPALPWAALMDHEDLTDFLDELAASAITHAPAESALAEVEKTCGTWRLIAEAQHAHNTAPGPDVDESVDKLTRLLAPTQALRVPEPGACSTCTDGPADWCPGCSTCRCETHNPGCVQAGNPR